jgi:glutaryl-CoA dehydrogenase
MNFESRTAKAAASFVWDDPFLLEDQLSEEERMIRDAAASFAADKLAPRVEEAYLDEKTDPAIFREMGDAGLLGVTIPEEYGGLGAGYVTYGLVAREVERIDSGYRSMMSVQSSLVMYPIHAYGSDEQKKIWLPAMARGEAIGCFGLTEPQGGSDPANMKTHAKRDGRDWILNGSKMWITNGNLADVAVVWAKTDEGVRGFLVEKDMTGFTAQEIENKFSLRASVTSALFLDNVRVPAANVLPGVTGMRGPLSCLTQARYGITWGVIGAAQACLNEALDYTRERVLFDRPLSHNQAIQLRLADMARRITTAQLLSLHLGRLKDRGRMMPTQVSVAKWNNCRMALDIARDARDMLGGSGISAEHVPIRHMLNLESVITYEGTESVHQLVVGKELTGVSAF